jgi:glyoxylase-like metal-dependent hydrolase (beta-lactamase superfamily II)
MRGPVEVAPGIYGLGTEMVNWYLVEEAGRLTAVDAGLPGFAATLDADLRLLGYSASDVEAVVLTHSDGDHTGVAPRLRDAGARVLIHAADEAALRKPGPKKGDASPRHVLANLWRREARTVLGDALRHGGARPSKLEGPETFSDGDVLDVPGRPRVVHTPGHTAGHSALLLEDGNVLFAGDALITHELIAKDAGVRLMPRFTNEDNAACLESLTRLEALDAELVLVGHGEPWREGPAAAAATARAVARDSRW